MAIFRWPETWDPFGVLRNMQRELERLTGRAGPGDARHVGGGSYPPVNVLSSADEIIVQCELAGVKREDVDVSITGETLVIAGTKGPAGAEGELRYHRRERGVGDFSRTIVLPDRVDAERIDAKLVDGILTIRLPKLEAASPRQVPVG